MKAIYGYKDTEHAIECIIVEIKKHSDGTLLYVGKCDGGKITAPAEMWKILN